MEEAYAKGPSHEAGLQSRDHAVILLVEKLAQRVNSTRLWISSTAPQGYRRQDVPLWSQKENSFQPEFLPSQTLQYVLIVNNKVKYVEKDKTTLTGGL